MKLPIVAYGDPVLRKKATDFAPEEIAGLKQLVADMFETMYNARGVGLAAPQVGLAKRLFVIDATPFDDEEPDLKDFKKAFVNAQILEETGEEWSFNEGCLSIPDVREDVMRKPNILIRYYDENWQLHEEEVTGFPARVIQHEYDHIEGKLFTDKLGLLRKQMLKSRLDNISKGKVSTDYKMRFPKQNKKR